MQHSLETSDATVVNQILLRVKNVVVCADPCLPSMTVTKEQYWLY